MKLKNFSSSAVAVLTIAFGSVGLNALTVTTPLIQSASAQATYLQNCQFTAEIYQRTNIRSGPGTNFSTVGSINPTLTVEMSTFERGTPIWDSSVKPNGAWDPLWFKLSDGRGYVASAVVQGYPPKSDCKIPPDKSANTSYLPFDSGKSTLITQGWNSSYTHGPGIYSKSKFAIDFNTRNTTGIGARSVRAGKVIFSGWDNQGFGNLVLVQYRDGKIGYYGHLKSVWVKNRQEVAGGQGLGEIGTTGNSTGIHLHYEERPNQNATSVPVSFKEGNFNFYNSGFSVTSQNPDGRR